MAEYLIYIKQHWMDALPIAEITEKSKNPNWKRKYDGRYQVGDIVEVRPDGYWTGTKAKGFNHIAFKVIYVPGQIADRKYSEELYKEDETGSDENLLKRRKYSIKNLSVSDKERLSLVQFNQNLNTKKSAAIGID